MLSGDFGETAVKSLAELVGLVVFLGAALAGDNHAAGGNSGETGEPDELPARTHPFRRLKGR
jgi:hypothetical protein